MVSTKLICVFGAIVPNATRLDSRGVRVIRVSQGSEFSTATRSLLSCVEQSGRSPAVPGRFDFQIVDRCRLETPRLGLRASRLNPVHPSAEY